jgi:hypothetical protein
MDGTATDNSLCIDDGMPASDGAQPLNLRVQS